MNVPIAPRRRACLVMLMSITCARSRLLAGDVQRLVVLVVEHQLLEGRRAGDVGALADVHEHRVVGDVERFETGQPAGRLDLRQRARAHTAHRLAIAAMCGGVVRSSRRQYSGKPDSAQSRMCSAMNSGVSS